VWIGVALLILKRHRARVRRAQAPMAASILVVSMVMDVVGRASV
jgi:hypothetical protein